MSKILVVKDVAKSYGGRLIFDRVSFDIYAEETIVLTGSNGAGKTTLARVLLNIEKKDSGEIVDFIQNPGDKGYVPQFVNVNFDLPISVLGLLDIVRGEDRHKDVQNALNLVGIKNLENEQICLLSRGQLQKVLIAMGLVTNPKFIVFDEPLQGLDDEGIAHFYKLLKEIKNSAKTSILVISHQVSGLKYIADRFACLNNNGVEFFPRDRFFSKLSHAEKDYKDQFISL